jgi:hypothetical protein
MFKKLELSIDNLKLSKLIGEKSYCPPNVVELEIKDKVYLYEEIKKHINFKIEPDYELIGIIKYPGTFPHRDGWNVSLNYYMNTNNEITTFWKKENDEYIAGDIGYNFDDSLKEIGSFQANKNEFYLLDTKIIHSVKVINPTDIRFILRVVWLNNSFEEILNSITPL